MKSYYLSILIVLASCANHIDDKPIEHSKADSIMQVVKQHHDSSIVILNLADKKTMLLVGVASDKLDSIQDVHAGLKGEYDLFKRNASSLKIIQRDTVYITEKKNFWGKTKRITDSTSSSIQDTIVNQEQR